MNIKRFCKQKEKSMKCGWKNFIFGIAYTNIIFWIVLIFGKTININYSLALSLGIFVGWKIRKFKKCKDKKKLVLYLFLYMLGVILVGLFEWLIKGGLK